MKTAKRHDTLSFEDSEFESDLESASETEEEHIALLRRRRDKEAFEVQFHIKVFATDEEDADRLATKFLKKRLKEYQLTELALEPEDQADFEDIDVSIELAEL